MSESNGGRALGAFFCGLGLGIVGSVLVAPKSGKETRRLIASKAQNVCLVAEDTAVLVTEAVQDIRSQVSGTVSDVRDQFRDTLKDARTRLQDAVDAGRKAYRDELDRIAVGAQACPSTAVSGFSRPLGSTKRM
jgi:gas vesicle protein